MPGTFAGHFLLLLFSLQTALIFAHYAYILNYLASLYYRTRDYEKAELLYMEANAIIEFIHLCAQKIFPTRKYIGQGTNKLILKLLNA